MSQVTQLQMIRQDRLLFIPGNNIHLKLILLSLMREGTAASSRHKGGRVCAEVPAISADFQLISSWINFNIADSRLISFDVTSNLIQMSSN